MWLVIAERRLVASRPLTHPASCECHTSVCPRIVMPWLRAWLVIWSAGAKLNWLRLGSTVSHFISFSGVTPLNSVVHVLAYCASPRWLVETAAPKYLPRAAAAAPSVLAASAVPASATAPVAASAPAAATTRAFRAVVRRELMTMTAHSSLY